MDIGSKSKYPAGALSNFSPHPFVFDRVKIASMEGFLQSLKFKDANMQKEICQLVGIGAKRAGAKKNWQQTQTLYWKGEPIPRGSDRYQELLDDVYEAMFEQNAKAKKALMASGHSTLTHSIGRIKKSETVLTRREFTNRLSDIRRRAHNAKMLDDLGPRRN
jgi:predicted NAD-dependent protein-ADP-ribosyltransferase YbiA (DUF1768 family)